MAKLEGTINCDIQFTGNKLKVIIIELIAKLLNVKITYIFKESK
jgi:hypothetical protein